MWRHKRQEVVVTDLGELVLNAGRGIQPTARPPLSDAQLSHEFTQESRQVVKRTHANAAGGLGLRQKEVVN